MKPHRYFSVALFAAVLAWAEGPAAGTQPQAGVGDDRLRFTPPPGQETDALKELIGKASARLEAGESTTSLLTDPSLLQIHELPRFRNLIRKWARSSTVKIVAREEPGQPLVVSGRVVDSGGRPVKQALVYVYQTSARGWYSDRAAHFNAHEGDRKHARLFGYLRTDADGRFELDTIRPGGYPSADLPCHIHVEVGRGDNHSSTLVTEVQFDDDPRLTAGWRKRSRQEGFVIAGVRKDREGIGRIHVEFQMR